MSVNTRVLEIGPYKLTNNLILAPMAGVTDQPFRTLCKKFGAGMVVAEMITSDTRLWNTRKSLQRRIHADEPEPRSVQIAGAEPAMMAKAAQMSVENGAQIIDINMGCPAKKVCSKAAGSALLKDEKLVGEILDSVVQSVSVPVTLKIRTGWCRNSRNAVQIGKLAESLGIQALAIHGRTRACRYQGDAEYDTIAAVKQNVNIPVIANGDINSPEKAKKILDYTGADGLMIGRAAHGRPWIFAEIARHLAYDDRVATPALDEKKIIVINHLKALYEFYGEFLGLRIARKHMGWYMAQLVEDRLYRQQFYQLETPIGQITHVHRYFQRLSDSADLAA